MSETAVGPGLQAYMDLSLSRSGGIAKDLMERADHEAVCGALVLTGKGDDGALSQGLTPGMNDWLTGSIGPVRGSAIAELEVEARGIKITNAIDGMLLEAEEDKADRRCAKRTTEILEAFNAEFGELLRKAEGLRDEYQVLRVEENRDAKTPNRFIEWGVLLPLILLPESMLNFESFRRAPIIQSDAMALGATLLVGLGIASAAYCIGLFVRQFHYFMRPDEHDGNRSGWPLWGIGSVVLAVSIGSVAVARYYYLLPKIHEAIVLGDSPPNLAVSIGSLLFGNFICFLVGVAITYFLHDPNPEFAAKAYWLKKTEEKLEKARRKNVTAKLNEVNARAQQDKEAAIRKAAQMNNKPGYGQLRERVAKLQAKDAEVIGALQAYRALLAKTVKDKSTDLVIEQRDPAANRADPVITVPVDRFAALPLRLYRSA